MINLNVSTLIYKPVSQVFNFISAPENDIQWQYGTISTESVSNGIEKIGTFFRTVAHMFGHRNVGTFEVIEHETDRKYKFRSLSGPLHSKTTYTLEAAADGNTRISISIQAHIINFFQMDERLLELQMKRQLKENLARLKNLLEVETLLQAN